MALAFLLWSITLGFVMFGGLPQEVPSNEFETDGASEHRFEN